MVVVVVCCCECAVGWFVDAVAAAAIAIAVVVVAAIAAVVFQHTEFGLFVQTKRAAIFNKIDFLVVDNAILTANEITIFPIDSSPSIVKIYTNRLPMNVTI